ncbi:Rhamnogalacturonan acetylesterase RgaE [Penicillium longicatenatum]|uniref:Rhamnogalacturonan acetylesterase RgaE n=1 Tax=Penicillium longicatenatum TaxID=1561947 RepID=UPI0025483090|nr:Rhamnogalacturonan acetylesterase RgaE [Penicillium longicatenatum]KAJ5639116.1 Rhamnogalacturonan acetylesterase RgaE [Penicillium longicatenatum]
MKTATLFSVLIPSVLGSTIYFAGDSTMAKGGGGTSTNGWAEYVSTFTTSTISNQAIAGRSARSYTREGRFTTIANEVKAGDWVVIEFGHNDGGSLTPTDNGRTDCSGTGTETCTTVYDGVTETVLTFPAYLENAAKTFKALGANVLISSQTPNNPWETGSFVYSPSRFVAYAELAAETAGVAYVDHGAYVASIFDTLGDDVVTEYYPLDHTHTSPAGALVVAEAFFKAVVCGGVALKSALNTTSFPGNCL